MAYVRKTCKFLFRRPVQYFEKLILLLETLPLSVIGMYHYLSWLLLVISPSLVRANDQLTNRLLLES